MEKTFKTPEAWRAWLQKNHDRVKSVRLVLYKIKTGRATLTYEAALREALCFGWIDSIVHRIDDERHTITFTPRKPKSIWSAANKKRIAELEAEGLMAAPGLAKVRAARADGSWDKLAKIEERSEIPPDLVQALKSRAEARAKWDKMAPSQKKMYSWWIISAKRPETRERRVLETIARVMAGRKAGM